VTGSSSRSATAAHPRRPAHPPVVGHDLPIIIVAQSVGYVLTATFTAASGTHTFNAFYARNAGTGTLTPTGTRELYVEGLGPA
jgi:hypothetical protein